MDGLRALFEMLPDLGPAMAQAVTRLGEDDWPLIAAAFATAAKSGDSLTVGYSPDPDATGLAWVTVRRPG